MKSETDDNASLPAAHNKQDTGDAPLGTQEAPRFNGQVNITVHSQRNRLTDSDGAWFKYALDSIVDAGILHDDSPKYVPESPRKTQEQVAGIEMTVITIEDIVER